MKILIFAFLNTIMICSSIKKPNQDIFLFEVEDVFQLSSGQLAISGQIKSGEIKKSEKLKIIINNVEIYVVIEKMEIFAKTNQFDIGFKNDYVALTISGLAKSQIQKGMIFTK